MAESPQPPALQPGVSDPHAPTASAEDRKAAAALSSLDAQDDDAGVAKKNVDQKALGEAMKNLSVSEGKKDGNSASPEKKKVVKVDAAHVAVLVNHLELPKMQVMELLRAHDGDLIRALHAFVTDV